jgi:hypothetical protein
MIVGIASWFYLPSYPETCSFLNQADRVLASMRGKDGMDQESSTRVSSNLHKVSKGT